MRRQHDFLLPLTNDVAVDEASSLVTQRSVHSTLQSLVTRLEASSTATSSIKTQNNIATCYVAHGFTLLEVLVAMSILIVIVAVVYASFASVTDTISVARVRTEEMRLRQFLERSLRTNLTSVYVDRGFEQQVFQFIGTNDENTTGPRDSLRFVSTNQLMGGMALPGDFKEVRYEVFGGEEGRLQLSADQRKEREAYEQTDESPDQAKLEATETPLLASNAQAVDESGNIDLTQQVNTKTDVPEYQAPSWSVPVRTFDITYYDGSQWLEEWDSQAMGKLPWCIRVRINFARTDEEIQAEKDQNIDIVDSPDFEIVVPLPLSLGQQTDSRTLAQAGDAAADAEEQTENAPDNVSGVPGATGKPSGTPSGTGTKLPSGISGRGGLPRGLPSGVSGSSIFGRSGSPRSGGMSKPL